MSNIVSYLLTDTCLIEAFLMSTHNKCFNKDVINIFLSRYYLFIFLDPFDTLIVLLKYFFRKS